MVSQTKSYTHIYVGSLVAFNDTQGKRWVGIILKTGHGMNFLYRENFVKSILIL